MTTEEVDTLIDHITVLEARVRDLEFEVEEYRAREAAHEAAVQDRVARLIEHQQRRRVEGEQVLRKISGW